MTLVRLALFGLVVLLSTRRCGRARFARPRFAGPVDSGGAPA